MQKLIVFKILLLYNSFHILLGGICMKKISLLLCLALFLSLFSPALAEDTIKIGGITSLTGDLAQYGLAIREGFDLYVEEINAKGGVLGKQVEVLWEDAKGDISDATNAYNKLAYQDLVVGVVGVATSKPTIAVAELASGDGMPMITASATALEVTEGKPNVFRACFLDDFQAKTMANYAKDALNIKKVAVIYDNGDDYSLGLAENFKKQAEAIGLEVVAYESGASADVDFKAQLTNIKGVDPEALFLAYYYTAASNIMKQSVEVGLKDIYLLSADCMNGIETMFPDDTFNDLLSKLYYTDHFAADADTPEVKAFSEAFHAKYGKEPRNAFNATGYDAAMILLGAMEKAGKTDFADVVDAMKNTDMQGVTGRITFDENNNPIKSAFIMTIENGKEVFRAVQEP